MKKRLFIILLGLVMAVSGCQEKESAVRYETAAVATDTSKRVLSASADTIESETGFFYQNEDAVKERSGSFLGSSNELLYDDTMVFPYFSYDLDVYTDKSDPDIEYRYLKNSDSLLFYSNENGLDLGIPLDATKEELFSALENILAEKLLPEGVDRNQLHRNVFTNMYTYIDEDDIPTVSSDFLEGYIIPGENQEARYVVRYIYPISGIDTYEVYEFWLSEEHTLYQYHAMELGTFSLSDVAVDAAEVQGSVEKYCKDNFVDKAAAEKYEIQSQYVYKKKDGKLAVSTTLSLHNGEDDEELIELITSLKSKK
ncbi:MAG: hypothetical protein Q4C48_11590 [Lachnospiraceae bacterium]|nr:hypothetical protein [Lachnospiraceae bacterium]